MPAPRQLKLTTTAPEILDTEALSRLAEASAILREISLRRALQKAEQPTPVAPPAPEARPRPAASLRSRKVVRRLRRNVAP